MQNKEELVYTGERLVTNVANGTMVEHLHRYAFAKNFVKDKEVLDIASGEGYGSNLLAETAKNVVGVDISKEAIDHSLKKYNKNNLKYVVGAADKIPAQSESIDVIVSFETIEHHDKHEEMLLEIKRVLRKEGLLILSSPDKKNYSDIPKSKNEFHVKELYTEEFVHLIKTHFKFYYLFFQKEVYGSMIIPEVQLGNSDFKEYTGTYEYIKVQDGLVNPIYNICIASDIEIDKSKLQISFFDKLDLVKELIRKEENYNGIERQLLTVTTSKAYKIGRFLTYPVRLIRNLKSNSV